MLRSGYAKFTFIRQVALSNFSGWEFDLWKFSSLLDFDFQTSLRPYLIDPSSRATKWLMAYLQNNGHPVVSISLLDPKFSHELELAVRYEFTIFPNPNSLSIFFVRFGKALIVHEMDEIDPILMPLLRGDFVSHGTRDTIQIGDKFVDYNQDFKLFMTTRNPAPVLPPDSAAGVTIVNFTTTRAGLTTQVMFKHVHGLIKRN